MTQGKDDKAATTIPDGQELLTLGRGFRLRVLSSSAKADDDAQLGWISRDQRRCLIGTNDSCDLVLQDGSVSRFHCELLVGNQQIRVRDLDSTNGTIIDGTRVVEGFLRRDSVLRLGRTLIRFELTDQHIHIPISQRTEFGDLVGKSVLMRSVFALLERAALLDTKLLLVGETGTGKSAAARAIHEESARKDGPFIAIDCGAISMNLLESELFGHVRGAFTGALDRVGAFEMAANGTLFLDEIGELPMSMQSKLLTALDENRIRRVGETLSRPVNVRVIAATNRDLRREVNARRFREDLYYRIAVVSLEMPPLRQRPEDIPMLVERMLARKGASPEQIQALTDEEVLHSLCTAAWPGNIRELDNHIERCLWFGGATALVKDPVTHPDSSAVEVDATLPYAEAKRKALQEIEKAYLLQLMRMHGDRASAAAHASGLDRSYFYRLLRRHQISRSPS